MNPLQSALVFDLDGTLAWTERYWLPVMAQVLKDIRKDYGWEPAISKVEEALQHLGKPDTEIMAEIYPAVNPTQIKEALALKAKIWDGMLADQPFELYPNALACLQELKGRGWTLYVSSNCGEAYLKEMLDSTGLGTFITDAACLGGNPGLHKWEFTEKLMASTGIETGFFIGDSIHDMEAGNRNGLGTIFADYGYGRCDDTSLIDHRLNNISDLPALLNRLLA